MKLSTYFENIIIAIFCPSFLIESEEDNKKLKESYENCIKSYENCIKSNKDYAETGWKHAYENAEKVDKLSKIVIEQREDIKKYSEKLIVLERKLERYYKTGKNSNKK